MDNRKASLSVNPKFVEKRIDKMRAAVIAPQGKTLAGMSEEKIVEQARNYCIAIGADPDRIVTGEDAKKYLDYIGEDVENARRNGWNTDCWLPLIALGCALALSACASSGVKVDPSKLDQFTVGKSTCAEVRAALGQPKQQVKTIGGDTKREILVWKYSYAGVQSHPENFIPVVGAFVGGVDTESSVVMLVFYTDHGCVLAGTRYATSGMGTGTNLEGLAQERKDTTEVK